MEKITPMYFLKLCDGCEQTSVYFRTVEQWRQTQLCQVPSQLCTVYMHCISLIVLSHSSSDKVSTHCRACATSSSLSCSTEGFAAWSSNMKHLSVPPLLWREDSEDKALAKTLGLLSPCGRQRREGTGGKVHCLWRNWLSLGCGINSTMQP